jgi:hypothetical protein
MGGFLQRGALWIHKPECSLRVTPERPGFEAKMEIAESLMQRYRNALRELAK